MPRKARAAAVRGVGAHTFHTIHTFHTSHTFTALLHQHPGRARVRIPHVTGRQRLRPLPASLLNTTSVPNAFRFKFKPATLAPAPGPALVPRRVWGPAPFFSPGGGRGVFSASPLPLLPFLPRMMLAQGTHCDPPPYRGTGGAGGGAPKPRYGEQRPTRDRRYERRPLGPPEVRIPVQGGCWCAI